MKPQEPIPHNYSIAKLNMIFALSSLVLVMVTGAIVLYDYVRGWKWFQLEFMRIQREMLDSELATANDDTLRKQLAALDEQTKQAQAQIAADRRQYVAAQRELESWEGKHYAADQDYRFAKAVLDARRYELEAAVVRHDHSVDERQRAYDEQAALVDDLNVKLQDVTRQREVAREAVDKWQSKISDVEEKRKELTAQIALIQRQLSMVSANTPNIVLNLPMLDFVNPTLKIDQVVLNDLFIDMNYMSVPRVDRCMTCHRAIDRPGFESKKEAKRLAEELTIKLEKNFIAGAKRAEAEARVAQLKRIQDAPKEIFNPWRTHPRLDVFVGSASPHPLLEYGCTACHRGQDRATEFGRAGHTPPNPKMEDRWSKPWPALSIKNILMPWKLLGGSLEENRKLRNWDFAINPFLDTPMYSRHYYEAGCLKCHAGQIQIDEGHEITKAMQTVELYGCHACHKIGNWRFSDLRKPGPDLNGIAEKTTPDWVYRWIADPSGFRSTTRMPSFFFQRNMIGPEVPAREKELNLKYQNAEIHAIVTYLFSNSTHRAWSAPTSAGDAARGKQLVDSLGCMGCHIAQDTVQDEGGAQRVAHRDDFPLERHYGFNLVGMGSKTHPAWIFNWIKDPKAYYPTAPMPSLRLSDQEASDITAYLTTLSKPDFMKTAIPAPDPTAVRDLAKGYLVNTLSVRDANAKLASMPLQEQLKYLGQRSIEKYGCYSCHEIRGFEGLKPIGTELTIEGSKNLHLFDFGFVHDYEAWDGHHEHIKHTVPSWIYNKVREPRVYDDKRSKPYNDKLKMPNFHLSEHEARLITTVVLGLTKERVEETRMAESDSHERQIQEGRKLISQRNCRGCHVVDRTGRAIAALIEDPNFLPPDLTPQGGRAQSDWLFNFLKDPTVTKIRPWLSVRMPTFHFTDEEASRVVASWAAQGEGAQYSTKFFEDTSARNIAIGREVFTMLRCQQCHAVTPVDPANPPLPNVADTQSLAPNLTLSRLRLRHEWIADWIRRPDEMIPGTRMPTNFPRDRETGGFQSPLAQAIDTPQFAQHKAALRPHFTSDEELRKTMADAVALTNYLRDYIWSVGVRDMRRARPDIAPVAPPLLPEQPITPPPQPAFQVERDEAPPARAGAAGR